MFNFIGGLHLNLHDQLTVAKAKGIVQRLAKRCLDEFFGGCKYNLTNEAETLTLVVE